MVPYYLYMTDADAVTPSSNTRSYTLRRSSEHIIVPRTVIFNLLACELLSLLLYQLANLGVCELVYNSVAYLSTLIKSLYRYTSALQFSFQDRMVFARPLCSKAPTRHLPNSTPTWIGSTQTSRPFVHFCYLSSFTCDTFQCMCVCVCGGGGGGVTTMILFSHTKHRF